MNQQMPVQLEDLYLLIGEREVIRYLQQKQITEMSQEIDRLRAENGKLGQPEDNNAIRRVPSGVQGARSGFLDNVQGSPNQSSGRDHSSGPIPSEVGGMGRGGLG